MIEADEDGKYWLELGAKKQVSHDTILLSFKFPSDDWILGSEVSQHVCIFNKPDCQPPRKPYTPVSPINQKGTVDILLKVYEKTEQYPNEKLTQYLDSLKVGDKAQFNKPFGKMAYLGDGNFRLKGEVVKKSKVGFIAGGTGITPPYQVIQAMHLAGDKSCDVKFLYSNKTLDDILLEPELNKIDAEMDNI